MTKKVLFIATLLLAIVSLETQARIRITVGEHEKVKKVADLPDSTYYETKEGKFIDLGCLYTVYEVAGIPVYTVEKEKLVGFSGDTCYELDDEIKEVIKQDLKADDLEALNKMPFWDSWGGKLTIAGVIIIIIAYNMIKNRGKDDEEEEETQPEEEKKTEE